MNFASPTAELPSFSFPSLDDPSRQTYAWAGTILLTALVIYNSLWRRTYVSPDRTT